MDTRQGLAQHIKAVRRFTGDGAPGRRFGNARPRKRFAEAVRRATSTPTRRFERDR